MSSREIIKAITERHFAAVEESLRKRLAAGLPMPVAIEWGWKCLNENTCEYALTARFIESLEDQEG